MLVRNLGQGGNSPEPIAGRLGLVDGRLPDRAIDGQGVDGKVRKETASARRSLPSNQWKRASRNIESP